MTLHLTTPRARMLFHVALPDPDPETPNLAQTEMVEADLVDIVNGSLVFFLEGVPIRGFAVGQWLDFAGHKSEPQAEPEAPDRFTEATAELGRGMIAEIIG